jgi:hypothetical protein
MNGPFALSSSREGLRCMKMKQHKFRNTGKAEGTSHGRRNVKDTNPLIRLYWSFLFGVVKQFCRFWIWSETECKTPAEYGLHYNATPPPPHPSHKLSVYAVHFLWEGGEGRGCQREGTVEGLQYINIFPSSVHKLDRKYQPWVNVSPFYKICSTECRKVC